MDPKKPTPLELALAQAKIERDGISRTLSSTCAEIDRLTAIVLERLKARKPRALRLVKASP